MEDSLDKSDAPESAKHQADRVSVAGVVRVGIGLTIMVVLSMVGMVLLFRGLDAAIETELPGYATRPQDVQIPPPQLDPAQSSQLQELRTEHRRILNSYEWIDKESGIARIPIDRAMELVTEELQARDQGE